MTDAIIGRGVIENVVDNTKLEAGMNNAKRTVRSLGETTRNENSKNSQSIDRYIKRLEVQQKTYGMSAREAELYKLQVRGASAEQLKAANNTLRLTEAQEKGAAIGERLARGIIALTAAATLYRAATLLATNQVINQVAGYQGLSEKIGDTASNLASLKTASDLSGVSLDTVAAASIKLTASLSNDAKSVNAAVKSLGINIKAFREASPVEQLDMVAAAMAKMENPAQKTAAAVALFGKSGAELIPFLNDLADGGERTIRLTDEQIAAADAYSKSLDRLRSRFGSYLELLAVDAVPTMQSIEKLFEDLASNEAAVSTATDILKGTMAGAVTFLQTVAIVGSDVGFVFLGLGREIGAVAAQLTMLATGDLKGYRAISDAVKEDGRRAREELDKFQARVMSISSATPTSDKNGSGGAKSGAGIGASQNSDEADKIAKARLTADLERIKKNSEVLTSAYADAERVMQARRSAGLIEDREYYLSKLSFIRLTSDAQEQALKEELQRLQKEQAVGAERVELDRKILDAQDRLSKVRSKAVNDIEILSIQETEANRRIAQSYRDAEDAAQSYLDTLRLSNARQLAGMGAGGVERSRLAGRTQIDDRYEQQRRELEKSRRDSEFAGTFGAEDQKRYDEELARIQRFQATALEEYDKYYAERLRLEGDWSIGASEALQNYYDNAQNVSRGVEEMFTNAFGGMEDALVEFVRTGKLDFKSLADSIISDLIRIQIRQSMSAAMGGGSSGGGLFGLLGMALNAFGGTGATAAAASSMGGDALDNFLSLNNNFAGRAVGGPVSAGGVYRVNEKGPELLSVAGEQYLMMGNQSGTVHPNAGAGASGVTFSATYNIDARADRAQLLQDMKRISQQSNADFADKLNRSRAI